MLKTDDDDDMLFDTPDYYAEFNIQYSFSMLNPPKSEAVETTPCFYYVTSMRIILIEWWQAVMLCSRQVA